jgi:two-component system cell cycle sensor histidine kinase/response regulator CckA
VHLVLDVAKPDCYIWADPIAVEQVIVNLVSNAKDAVQPGGTVTIRVYTNSERVDDVDAGQPPLELPCQCLEVEDNGSGMDPATLARLSEPFFTTKPVGKGTGLGLSVVYGVVRQSNGWIRVHSTPGSGTRFRLFFPLHAYVPTPEKTMEHVGARATGQGRTVLVVEDESLLRESVTRILKRRGYEVLAAEDAEEAAFRIRRSSVRPSLLISDVVLPDGSGLDVRECLNRRWTGIPALFITGYWGEEANRVLSNTAFRLLEKPFTEEQLLIAVERALG